MCGGTNEITLKYYTAGLKSERRKKETDFEGYRGMKTSSSTQLLSLPSTDSRNAWVGHYSRVTTGGNV